MKGKNTIYLEIVGVLHYEAYERARPGRSLRGNSSSVERGDMKSS